MKYTSLSYIAALTLLVGCTGNKGADHQTGELITIDVTADYPEKELILQDFMDVEYIPLDNSDEYITQGVVKAVGKNHIFVANRNFDGDIFVFDRSGKGVKKINRKGNSGEEYNYMYNIVCDEKNQELFVTDLSQNKLFVYDFDGTYKRALSYKESCKFISIQNFDQDHLICSNEYFSNDTTASPIHIISKQDGSIIATPDIKYGERKSALMRMMNDDQNAAFVVLPSTLYPILPMGDDQILLELSSDTVYRYSSDHSIKPFLVRTPSIQTMNPEVFLFTSLFTDKYYFMEAVRKEYDFNLKKGFPSTNLVYDTNDKRIYTYKVYNDDFTTQDEVNLKSRPLGGDILSWQTLEAYKLIEAYEKGELKGRLKEIAATLNEDSNPVIMLLKSKQ